MKRIKNNGSIIIYEDYYNGHRVRFAILKRTKEIIVCKEDIEAVLSAEIDQMQGIIGQMRKFTDLGGNKYKLLN